MCPWPRIQAAMLDEKSLLVTYKDWRGEPRGSVKKAAKDPDAFGDCIDCNQCVAVCPTGIDIREGPQIGCITCALCIDACNRVMDEVGRPRGLIDYATLEDCEREAAGEQPRPVWKTLLRPRTLFYFSVWGAIGLAMLFALGVRSHTELSAAADRNPPFMLMSDGSIRNAFTLKIRNMESRPRRFTLALEGLDGAVMWSGTMSRDNAARSLAIAVDPDQTQAVRTYVVAPAGTDAQDFAFSVVSIDEQAETDRSEVRFVVPGEAE
jgi:cytochrome c oxidase accessory protein FixG